MLHILYLVHDLSDPAVRRRVIMLQAGGAKVTVAGFRRAQDSGETLTICADRPRPDRGWQICPASRRSRQGRAVARAQS